MTISRTFKSATNSGTFESASIFFSLLDGLGNFKQIQLVALSKVPLLVALFNVQLIVVCTVEVQAHRPFDSNNREGPQNIMPIWS